MYGEETYWTYSGPVAAALVLRLGHQVTTMLGVLLASAGKHFSSSIYSDFQVSWQPGSTLSWDHSCKISWSFISALGASLVLDLAWCTFLPWTSFHTTLTAGTSLKLDHSKQGLKLTILFTGLALQQASPQQAQALARFACSIYTFLKPLLIDQLRLYLRLFSTSEHKT